MTLLQVRKIGNRVLIFAFGLILLLFFIVQSCKSDTVEVKTKEKKGSFKPVKPTHVNITNKPVIENGIPLTHIDTLIVQNDSLIELFKRENDSLKLVIFKQAIQLRSFTQTWEDNDLKATVSGITRGTVESIKLDYIIKPQSIKCPENPYRLLGGVEIGNSDKFNDFTAKANFGFQNRKGNIFSIGFDTDEKIYIGYSATLIKF